MAEVEQIRDPFVDRRGDRVEHRPAVWAPPAILARLEVERKVARVGRRDAREVASRAPSAPRWRSRRRARRPSPDRGVPGPSRLPVGVLADEEEPGTDIGEEDAREAEDDEPGCQPLPSVASRGDVEVGAEDEPGCRCRQLLRVVTPVRAPGQVRPDRSEGDRDGEDRQPRRRRWRWPAAMIRRHDSAPPRPPGGPASLGHRRRRRRQRRTATRAARRRGCG